MYGIGLQQGRSFCGSRQQGGETPFGQIRELHIDGEHQIPCQHQTTAPSLGHFIQSVTGGLEQAVVIQQRPSAVIAFL